MIKRPRMAYLKNITTGRVKKKERVIKETNYVQRDQKLVHKKGLTVQQE